MRHAPYRALFLCSYIMDTVTPPPGVVIAHLDKNFVKYSPGLPLVATSDGWDDLMSHSCGTPTLLLLHKSCS